VRYIPTCWPHERSRVRKPIARMEKELAGASKDIWLMNKVERYEIRPQEMENVSMAQFVANYYKNKNGECKKSPVPKVIRYRNYDMTELSDFKREMVLLHVPIRNEKADVLDQNGFLTLYGEHKVAIFKGRLEFESVMDMTKLKEYCQLMCVPQEDGDTLEEKSEEYVEQGRVGRLRAVDEGRE